MTFAERAILIAMRRKAMPEREARRQAELKRMAKGKIIYKPCYMKIQNGWLYVGHRPKDSFIDEIVWNND